MCLCHGAVYFGTGLKTVMLGGREGNRAPGGKTNDTLPPGLRLRSPAGWLPKTGVSSRNLHLWVPEEAATRIVCSVWWMLRQGCFAAQENTRTSPAWFVIGGIGCLWHSASSSNCVWWCTKRCVALTEVIVSKQIMTTTICGTDDPNTLWLPVFLPLCDKDNICCKLRSVLTNTG